MKENNLLKLSFLSAFAGLLAMWMLSGLVETQITSIDSITPDDVGRTMKACGSVKGKFTSKDHHTFFTLVDRTGEIKIAVFNSTGITWTPDPACVIGTVDVYKGELEILAEEVGNA